MRPLRLPRTVAIAATLLVAPIGAATAQLLPPGSVPSGRANPYPPTAQGDARNAVCMRLENALGQLNAAGNTNPDQANRYEEAINRQRNELDQAIMQARRIGCDQGRGFFLFGSLSRPPQCDQLNQQIGRMRNNLDRMTGEMGQMRGDDDSERRQIIMAMQENGCSHGGRSAALPPPARPRGFFESLFGGWREESTIDAQPLEVPSGSAFKTLCVRTCDGFYFPISYSTAQSKFAEDEQTCRRLCPAAEVALYSHRNPGEEVGRSVSISGRPYTELPAAFKYRQAFDPSCSCRAAGQSWAEALGVGGDRTIQQGDIVVTEERARQMAQPRPAGVPQGKSKAPVAPLQPGSEGSPPQTPAPAAEQQQPPPQTPAKPGERRVRVVGPQFYPVR